MPHPLALHGTTILAVRRDGRAAIVLNQDLSRFIL